MAPDVALLTGVLALKHWTAGKARPVKAPKPTVGALVPVVVKSTVSQSGLAPIEVHKPKLLSSPALPQPGRNFAKSTLFRSNTSGRLLVALTGWP